MIKVSSKKNKYTYNVYHLVKAFFPNEEIIQMCQVYGNDSKYASAINVMTTLLAVVTMPVFVYFYMNL